MAEGYKSFGSYFDDLVAQGGDPKNSMCFVWYVLSEAEAAAENA